MRMVQKALNKDDKLITTWSTVSYGYGLYVVPKAVIRTRHVVDLNERIPCRK